MQHDEKRSSRWYQEPIAWLVFALPVAVVVAGFVTLGIAIRAGGTGDTWPAEVQRMARVHIQTEDLGADRAAIALGLVGELNLDADTGVIRVRLEGLAPDVQQVHVDLIHPVHAAHDVALELQREGEHFGGRLQAPLIEAKAWSVQVAASDGAWRVLGRLERGRNHTRLAPAFAVE